MIAPRWERQQEIFASAIALPPDEQKQYVINECGDDTELRDQLFGLLDVHRRAADFLEAPAAGAGFHPDHFAAAAQAPVLDDGARVGPYRIVRLIGSGGMASVYLAERADAEFEQQVAIKVIRGSAQGHELAKRLRAERQTLASLDHPNIARLLDGGTMETGDPYLVMEFIDGERVIRYCSEEQVPLADRLELFKDICAAVDHAHRNLVLHRDIKPANILVTEAGQPKLLDFGIAKLLDGEGSVTVHTTTAVFLTPDYASPEQIRGETATTATDIYSLGLVLFELLTGRRPYTVPHGWGPELLRVICEQEAPRPSRVITEEAGDDTLEMPESTDRLRRQLSGDLDHIVLMALRKDPDRRYPSARALAEDIDRHLTGQPVLARRGTMRYRATRFMARNRGSMAIAAMLVVLLVGGVFAAWSTWQRQRAENVAHAARAQLLSIESREALEGFLAQGVPEQIVEQIGDIPDIVGNYENLVATKCERFHVLDAALTWRRRTLDRRNTEPVDAVEGRMQLARSLLESGRIGQALTEVEAARRHNNSLPVADRLPEPFFEPLQAECLWLQGETAAAVAAMSAQPDQLLQSSLTRNQAVRYLLDRASYLGDVDQRESLLNIAAARRVAGDDPVLTAQVDHAEGKLLWYTRHYAEAEPLLRRAAGLFQQHLEDPDLRTAQCLIDLSLIVGTRGKWDRMHMNPGVSLWRRGYDQLVTIVGSEGRSVVNSRAILTQLLPASKARYTAINAAPQLPQWYAPNHSHRLFIEALGDALTEDKTAHSRLSRILERLKGRLPPSDWRLGVVGGWLGQALNRVKSPLTIETFDAALALLESTLGRRHPHTVIVRNHRKLALGGKEGDGQLMWPYARAYRDDDDTAEREAEINYEDDLIEKTIVVDDEVAVTDRCTLWVHCRPAKEAWLNYQFADDYRIRVNDHPDQEITFDVGLITVRIDLFQWIPFEIPTEWIRRGKNRFHFYRIGDPNPDETRSWEYNLLIVGVDTNSNADRSWWFGTGNEYPCCEPIGRQTYLAEKPLDRNDPMIVQHREQGYRETEGELMIFLEVSAATN